jgi:hypothetical protein
MTEFQPYNTRCLEKRDKEKVDSGKEGQKEDQDSFFIETNWKDKEEDPQTTCKIYRKLKQQLNLKLEELSQT